MSAEYLLGPRRSGKTHRVREWLDESSNRMVIAPSRDWLGNQFGASEVTTIRDLERFRGRNIEFAIDELAQCFRFIGHKVSLVADTPSKMGLRTDRGVDEFISRGVDVFGAETMAVALDAHIEGKRLVSRETVFSMAKKPQST